MYDICSSETLAQICGYVARCPNMAIQEADDSGPEDSEDYCLSENISSESTFASSRKGIHVRNKRDIRWVGSVIKDDGTEKYYK
jgi:hypothetical protein